MVRTYVESFKHLRMCMYVDILNHATRAASTEKTNDVPSDVSLPPMYICSCSSPWVAGPASLHFRSLGRSFITRDMKVKVLPRPISSAATEVKLQRYIAAGTYIRTYVCVCIHMYKIVMSYIVPTNVALASKLLGMLELIVG